MIILQWKTTFSKKTSFRNRGFCSVVLRSVIYSCIVKKIRELFFRRVSIMTVTKLNSKTSPYKKSPTNHQTLQSSFILYYIHILYIPIILFACSEQKLISKKKTFNKMRNSCPGHLPPKKLSNSNNA